jgi:hypothetical protein
MPMKKLIQYRTYKADATESVALLMEEGKILFACNFLELPDHENLRGISCIPEGVYDVVPHKSPKFGNCFYVKSVVNRVGILIHAGNKTSDTRGCLLPGIKAGHATLTQSRKTLSSLLAIAPEGFKLHIMGDSSRGVEALPPLVEIFLKLAPSILNIINEALQRKSFRTKIIAIQTIMAGELSAEGKCRLIVEVLG